MKLTKIINNVLLGSALALSMACSSTDDSQVISSTDASGSYDSGKLDTSNVDVEGIGVHEDISQVDSKDSVVDKDITLFNDINSKKCKTFTDSLADDDHIYGQKDAPLEIVWFGDYEDPFNRKFWWQTFPQLNSQYTGKGLVKIIFRDFPLIFHPNALKAAEAAQCAGEQGKYYSYLDGLFLNYDKLNHEVFYKIPADLNFGDKFSLEKFKICLNTGKYQNEIAKDFEDGKKLGVQGTPTFFINGKIISGAQHFSEFKKIIEKELDDMCVEYTPAKIPPPITNCLNNPVKVDLKDYPEYFVTNGKFNGYLVVGANGSALDTLSAVDIATGMKYNGKPVIFNDSTKLDSEIFSVSAQNMIVIGNPCVNSVTSALYCNPSKCNEGYELGKAKIELLQQVNGKIALVVAGYSAQDTRLAAKVLANKSSSLSGTSIELQLTKP